MNLLWHEWVGLAGVLLILLAFLLLQARKLGGQGLPYQIMNALGALGVIISLVFGQFNLPALLLEIAWLLISLFGITMAARRRREPPYDADRQAPH